MQLEEVREIIAALPRGRTVYRYFPDRYALWLLARVAGEGVRIAELKRGPYARLLARPAAKAVIAARPDGLVSAGDFQAAWPERWLSYRLTLGRWGSRRGGGPWYQTSRSGWNLVLQMNLSKEHNTAYRRHIPDHPRRPFEIEEHPVAGRRGRTLAWARLDLDLETGEALIEELQSDWVRLAELRRDGRLDHWEEFDDDDAETRAAVAAYVENVLAPHRKHWDKALLLAVLIFLVEEIGIRRIWMHEPKCGAYLKCMDEDDAPRSLYSALPRSFCFQQTDEPPSFLLPMATTRRAARERRLRFWHMAL